MEYLSASISNATSIDPGCIPLASVVLTIVSSIASVIGSLLIIGTFMRWKDLRTIARMIIVFLAIADLFTGIWYIFGAGIYIKYFIQSGFCHTRSPDKDPINDEVYNKLCVVQSFFTTLFPIASFIWTGNLAIYLFLSVFLQRMKFAKIFMLLSHVTSWGIPLITCLVILGTKRFGPSRSRTSGGWCWIYLNESRLNNSEFHEYSSYLVIEFFAGKVWEISVSLLSLVLCIAIKLIIWKRVKHPKDIMESTEYSSINMEKQIQAAYTTLDQKLIWLPIVFILMRIWGNIRFFISIPCQSCSILYNPGLVYLQSLCDPGQGWSNALLFVIFHRKISQRHCPCLYTSSYWCTSFWMRIISRRPPKRHKRRVVKPKVTKLEISASSHGSNREAGYSSGDDTQVGRERKDAFDEGIEFERDPLLLTDSLTSDMSTSSVLYHSSTNPRPRAYGSGDGIRYHYGTIVPDDNISINKSRF